ncbi:hypothetical protein FIV11_04020 [Lactiplantibacillus plantarum]|uniref:hypothetical protein n=1 Tax=Lactiplantibacillus plantarum TaxID=1590 RepID=UPI00264B10FE|nr:hypothetical protein [Lactiplantibacillus plantarum]MDN7060896.1 hypothetical protein [Lactiplantibacillus plantarum]
MADEKNVCSYCNPEYENDDFDQIEYYVSGVDEEHCGKIINFTAVQDVVSKHLIIVTDSGFDMPFGTFIKENNCIMCGRKL